MVAERGKPSAGNTLSQPFGGKARLRKPSHRTTSNSSQHGNR